MVCDVLIDMAKQALENEQKQDEELNKKGGKLTRLGWQS